MALPPVAIINVCEEFEKSLLISARNGSPQGDSGLRGGKGYTGKS